MMATAPAVGPGVVRLTTGEIVTTSAPSWDHVVGVWPERGADGIVRIFAGTKTRRVPLLELGHTGEDPEWLCNWLTSLAGAVRSVDR